MDGLWAISYASQASRPLSRAELDALLASAQAFNRRIGVSGALCYDQGMFIQYIEGPQRAVETVFQRIRASSLHSGVQELNNGPVDARQFEGWHMAFCHTPQSMLQSLANVGWEQQLPSATRNRARPHPGVSLLVDRWNRWMATGRPTADWQLRERAI